MISLQAMCGNKSPPLITVKYPGQIKKSYSANPAGFFSEPVKPVAAYASGQAGAGASLVVRDATCRLFGYHGLLARAGAFTLDHMFGF